MGDRAAATQPAEDAIELGSLAGRYSTADDSLPWWMSTLLLFVGLAVLLFVGSGEWAGRLGYVLFVAGALLLGQRYALQATTEVTADGLSLKGYYGRRTQVALGAGGRRAALTLCDGTQQGPPGRRPACPAGRCTREQGPSAA